MDNTLLKQLELNSDSEILVTDVNKVELIAHGTPFFHMSIHYTHNDSLQTSALYHHLHNELELFFLLKGHLRFHTPGQTHVISEGDLVIIQPNRLHGAFKSVHESVEFIAITIHKEFISSQLNDLIQQEFIMPLFSNVDTIKNHYSSEYCVQHQLNTDIEIICRYFVAKNYGYEIFIKAKLLEILYKIITSYPPSTSSNNGSHLRTSIRLQKSVAYIQKNYQDQMHVKELAELSLMSQGHFSRLFKSCFGMTVIEYINDYRLNMAAYLLSKGATSITETANATGFTNLSYFTKCFKTTFGVSPKDYRKI